MTTTPATEARRASYGFSLKGYTIIDTEGASWEEAHAAAQRIAQRLVLIDPETGQSFDVRGHGEMVCIRVGPVEEGG